MPQLLIGLLCLSVIVFSFLMAWVVFFRLSCRLCNLEQPTIPRTLGIVSVTFIIGLVVEAMLTAFVRFVYSRSNLPMWESGIASFFFGLPVDMILNAAIHSLMMKISVGKGIEVWFVQRIMLMAVFLPIFALIAITLAIV